MIERPAIFVRLLASVCALGGVAGLVRSQQPAPAAPRAVITQYCAGCHNARTKTAGLALDTISPENVQENREIWEKVVRKLRPRYMPPPGLPRPDERTYDTLLSYLDNSLDHAAAANPNPG